MADNKPFNPNKGHEDENASFQVMPHGDNGGLVSTPTPPQPTASGSQPGAGPRPMADIVPGTPEHHSIWHSKATYAVLGILIVLILGALAYFLVGPTIMDREPETPASRLSDVFLQQYFGSAECLEPTRCGDSADPDDDGLDNFGELKEQTDPTNNDSDDDGLADGDEVSIYLTNPANAYTDSRAVSVQNGYHDGSQVKNDYDPLTPGLKMSETRKQQITQDTVKYSLHEPTISTLATPAAPEPKTISVFMDSAKFEPASVTISVNDSVTWINRSSTSHQIASDPHPTHTALPELESGNLATNQTFTFKFTAPGTFTYHDHLNPSVVGTVTVQ